MKNQGIRIRRGRPADEAALLALLPRLAQFKLSPRRRPEDLWHGDAQLVKAHLAGQAPQCLLLVAEDAEQAAVAGFALVTLQPEFTGHDPGAHLEVLVVADGFEGRGVGRQLLVQAETAAKAKGAQSITLHVFNENQRAHRLYEASGYQSEIQRCIKWL
ncbi:MAG: GNAT family N-acetyltransferase [Pseudomonadales bacterium]